MPVIEKISGGVLVYIGSVEHPMLDNHFIEWIEIHTKDTLYRKHLQPEQKPEATFLLEEDVLFAREYCNKHGLWKTDLV